MHAPTVIGGFIAPLRPPSKSKCTRSVQVSSHVSSRFVGSDNMHSRRLRHAAQVGPRPHVSTTATILDTCHCSSSCLFARPPPFFFLFINTLLPR